MTRRTGEAIGAAVADAVISHEADAAPVRFTLPDALADDSTALVRELWDDLARSGSLWSNVRVVRDGRDMHPSEFMRARIGDGLVVHSDIDAVAVTDLLNAGATFVYNHLHETSYGIQRIQEILEYRIQARVWIQAYVTKVAASAFGLHRDDHNFVAVQLVGSKSWAIEHAAPELLGSGHGLFLRAGTPHAVSGVGELSLHVTIAFDWLPTSRQPGSRLSAEEFANHAKIRRLGSGLPIALDPGVYDANRGVRFAGRVRPVVTEADRDLLVATLGKTFRLDRRLTPGIRLLQSGRQVGVHELARACDLRPSVVTTFVDFGVKSGFLYCGS